MYENNGDNFINKSFLPLIDFIKNKREDFNLNISCIDNKEIISKLDSRMFFNAGKLLMLLYITNTNNISRKDIKYKNNRFYIDINKGNQNIKIINTITSENIINNLIEKSTYNKEFLPIEIEDINEKNLLDIEEGFKAAYEIFIYEKINLMNFFRKYHIKNSFSLINDIKILNEQDLKRQLKFVRLKLKGELKPNELVKNFIWFKHDKEKFIEYGNMVLDLIIKNGIISFNNNQMQLMWIGYFNEKIKPTKFKNLYIAILFIYMWKETSKKYYMQGAIQSINPILNDFSKVKNTKVVDDKYYEILKVLYLLGSYKELVELNQFIENNLELFDVLTLEDKFDCDIKREDLILQYIYDKSLNLLNSLVLE